MSMAEPTVYIDFLCPWAYRGAMWLADVEKAGRIRPQFRFFSLSQNHAARQGSAEPPIWERDPLAKGLPAFLAATAARAQGAQAGDRFRLALQRARHEDHLPVDDHATFRLVAEPTQPDVGRFERHGPQRQFSPRCADLTIGCAVARACFVACLFLDESQQPTCPQLSQSRRCTQVSPILRHSSQPFVFGLGFRI